jgi:hypothetical protein
LLLPIVAPGGIARAAVHRWRGVGSGDDKALNGPRYQQQDLALCLRFQPPARWSFAHHYSQHAFIRDDKSAKDLLNIADQDQPFPNFSGDSSVLPGIANLFQRGQLFAG